MSETTFSQSFSNKNEIEIQEFYIDTTSIEVIEWGYLDSVKGLYYHENELYSGPVIKYLSSGLMEGGFLEELFKQYIKMGLLMEYIESGTIMGRRESK